MREGSLHPEIQFKAAFEGGRGRKFEYHTKLRIFVAQSDYLCSYKKKACTLMQWAHGRPLDVHWSKRVAEYCR